MQFTQDAVVGMRAWLAAEGTSAAAVERLLYLCAISLSHGCIQQNIRISLPYNAEDYPVKLELVKLATSHENNPSRLSITALIPVDSMVPLPQGTTFNSVYELVPGTTMEDLMNTGF